MRQRAVENETTCMLSEAITNDRLWNCDGMQRYKLSSTSFFNTP